MRKVVGSLLIAAVIASLFSFSGYLGGLRTDVPGERIRGWEAYWTLWPAFFAGVLILIGVMAVLVAIMDWMMGD